VRLFLDTSVLLAASGSAAGRRTHGMDFLLTWNCRHIHNAFIEHRLQGVCEALGLSLPTLCTPPELMADYLQA
jgi:hypothetical protein